MRLATQRAWTLAALLALASGGGQAGIGTSTFTAQATVGKNCTISTTPVVLGTYDPIGTHRTNSLNSVGAVTVACVKSVTPTIALSPGQHASGTTRRMRDAANTDYLSYELYKPSTNAAGAPCSFPGTTPWRTTGTNLLTATAAPSRAPRTYNVCGTVPGGQNPRVGTYSDTVVATVTF